MSVENNLPLTPLSFQILVALADEPRHGYGIIKEIEAHTGTELKSSTGTMYLAIQRLERQGLVEETSAPATSGKGDSRRRYYRLSAVGAEVAAAESERLVSLLSVARHKDLLSGKQTDYTLVAAEKSNPGADFETIRKHTFHIAMFKK